MNILHRLNTIIEQQRRKCLQPKMYGQKRIYKGQKGHDFVKDLIKMQKSGLIARLGSIELGAIFNIFLKNEGYDYEVNERMRWGLTNNAGFYPTDDHSLEMFSKIYYEALGNVDILGVWYNRGEKEICESFCNPTKYVELQCLEPYYYENPWSELLKDKKVLVIHPFEKTILHQFQKRKLLFKDERVLPEFELITLQAVQSRGFNKTPFDTWFEALNYMKGKIDHIDFDVAIIGAGAYGLPLGAHVKGMNRMAIHLGGATQILFGIKGKRWDERWIGKNLYNEHWIRPYETESGQAEGRTGQDYW